MSTKTFLQSKIYEIREQRIMLDFDLAALYEIETKVLNQAVKRNQLRFPPDFMFRLSPEEWAGMRSQIVTAYPDKRNSALTPFAFTEQGVAMLSGVLKSEVAINVNIAIMRTFVAIRNLALKNADMTEHLKKLETKYDLQFDNVFEALRYLMQKEASTEKRNSIGYKK